MRRFNLAAVTLGVALVIVARGGEAARFPGHQPHSPESASQSCACFKNDSEIIQPPR